MTGLAGRIPRAVTVDLDDTLFPQRDYLHGAWRTVAALGDRHGVPWEPLLAALREIASLGSDRGQIIDRALAACGVPARPELVAELVAAFRAYQPLALMPYPGVPERLHRLRKVMPVGCVTDGDPRIQRAKLAALGLADGFDVVVVSDEIGRQFRTPHPVPFLLALHALGVVAADAVHIGDRPDKDIAGPHRLGMRAVRVLTGEYAGIHDGADPPDLIFDDAAGAMEAIAAVANADRPL
jgi:putative hydrolase of the HAD superfamily